MKLSDIDIRLRLSARGIPRAHWQLPDMVFETVQPGFWPEVWNAWITSLRANAPQCLEVRDIGGGKTRTVPRWRLEGGDCDNHALLCLAHAQMGNWISVCSGGPLVARTVGFVFYDAVPRAENGNRSGGHAMLWEIDHSDTFRLFEPGDGDYQEWLPSEYASAFFGFCA